MAHHPLTPGDPAPHFRQRSGSNPAYAFDTAAGRYLILCFLGSGGDAHAQQAVADVRARPDLFDDVHAAFFAVSNDPADESLARLDERVPGYRLFWDFDRSVARLYGAVDRDDPGQPQVEVRRMWVVLDPMLRVVQVIPFAPDRSDIAALIAAVAALPPPDHFAGFALQAPIIVLPNVFEPALCADLIARYDAAGGTPSGFMREVDGKTVLVNDPAHKRRRDHDITDRAMIEHIQGRIRRRVVPEIARVHQFHATRMERYLVACYHAEDRGHFQPHRDNTTRGTAHRRFAVSVNLNAEFEGGELWFPEYGPRGFRMPAGAAAIFSCSLLHAVRPVTAGRRYAFLPFLYDDAAAQQREANNAHLGEGIGSYRA
jgi:predicted 2-oxoglutarate/Fe(II)-dependent dioxygenase YbiX/peroxiredoxin